MNLILYHSADADGNGSAFEILNSSSNRFDLLGYNYNGDLDSLITDHYSLIISVDLNLSDKYIDILKKHSDFLVFIDHHIHKSMVPQNDSSFKYKDKDVHYIIDYNYAAMALTYSYLNNIDIDQEYNKLPKYIQLLEKYDRWYHENENCLPDERESILYFQYFINTLNLDVITAEGYNNWEKLKNVNVSDAVMIGKHIENYNYNYISKRLINKAIKTQFRKYKVLAVNSFLHNSRIFDAFEFDDYDIQFVFHYDHSVKLWRVSLYSENPQIDVSEIAKLYGGGGHKGAAGCLMTSDQLSDFLGIDL